MTDREICEKIIEDGDCITNTSCGNCFLNIDCDEAFINPDIKTDCAVYAAKKYLAEHPADNDWKPLEVDNLPPDILTGDYEFHEGFIELNDYGEISEDPIWLIIGMMSRARTTGKPCHLFFYRKRQPEEKTVEEMAEEWDDNYYDSATYNSSTSTTDRINAYIAGYNKAAKC